MSAVALAFEDVTVRYGTHEAPVLHSISLRLSPGERVALVGLNGSGKTTLLLAAVGLLPHTGHISVAGMPVTPTTLAEVRQRVGFLFNVPEDQLLFPQAIEDVMFGLRRQGLRPAEAVTRAAQELDRLGVGALARLPLHHLSHGQKQRVALAGALALSPAVLLLDEPTSALDPVGQRDLGQLLTKLDAAMLIATHDLSFAEQVCHRILLLEDGRLALEARNATPIRQRWQLT